MSQINVTWVVDPYQNEHLATVGGFVIARIRFNRDRHMHGEPAWESVYTPDHRCAGDQFHQGILSAREHVEQIAKTVLKHINTLVVDHPTVHCLRHGASLCGKFDPKSGDKWAPYSEWQFVESLIANSDKWQALICRECHEAWKVEQANGSQTK